MVEEEAFDRPGKHLINRCINVFPFVIVFLLVWPLTVLESTAAPPHKQVHNCLSKGRLMCQLAASPFPSTPFLSLLGTFWGFILTQFAHSLPQVFQNYISCVTCYNTPRHLFLSTCFWELLSREGKKKAELDLENLFLHNSPIRSATGPQLSLKRSHVSPATQQLGPFFLLSLQRGFLGTAGEGKGKLNLIREIISHTICLKRSLHVCTFFSHFYFFGTFWDVTSRDAEFDPGNLFSHNLAIHCMNVMGGDTG